MVRISVLGAAMLAVSGCSNGLVESPSGRVAENKPLDVEIPEGGLRKLAVANGAFLVSGPEGYCIDPKLTQVGARVSVVLMARCTALGGTTEPGEPGLMSVTVSRSFGNAARYPSAQEIEEAVRSGASPLAPEGVEVLKTESDSGLFVMQARDTVSKSNSFAQTHWRSVFAAKGFSVATRLNVFKEQPISTSGGFETLKSLADQIKADNGVSESETVAAVSKPKTNTGAAQPPGLFGRIFRRN